MCADYRFLAMTVDKFSVTYYERFLFCYAPTYKILNIFKLIFEDIMQISLQSLYLLLANKEDKNLAIIIVSICFAIPSMGFSIMAIRYNSTSSLTNEDYDEMVKKIKITSIENQAITESSPNSRSIKSNLGSSFHHLAPSILQRRRQPVRNSEDVHDHSDIQIVIDDIESQQQRLPSGGSMSTLERAPDTQRKNVEDVKENDQTFEDKPKENNDDEFNRIIRSDPLKRKFDLNVTIKPRNKPIINISKLSDSEISSGTQLK